MQRSQHRNLGSKARLNNIDPLLLIIRAELGADWGYYREFLERAAAAKASGENVSAWVDHIEPLVQKPALRFAHQGVLFLLGEMDVTMRSEAPPPTNTTYPSRPLPTQHPPPLVLPPVDMQRDFIANNLPMSSFNFNPSIPPAPVAANFLQSNLTSKASLRFNPSTPSAPAPSRLSQPGRTPTAFFKSNIAIPLAPTSANTSQPNAQNIAIPGKKQLTTDQLLRNPRSAGFVLHQDPAFRRDVHEFFGHTWPAGKPNTDYYDQTDIPSVYKAADDDLAVWKAGVECVGGVKDGGGEDQNDSVRSVEDAQRERVLDGLRYKLFKETP